MGIVIISATIHQPLLPAMKVFLKTLLFLTVLASPLLSAATPAQRLQQLVDYLGVDYGGAVQHGKVVDASEYQEMVDFAANLVTLAAQLPERPQRGAVQAAADELSGPGSASAPLASGRLRSGPGATQATRPGAGPKALY